MKNIIIASLLFASAIPVAAQIEKGNFLLTGGLGFSNTGATSETKIGNTTTTREGIDYNSYNFNLKGGYFIANNFALGLGLGYDFFGSKFIDGNDERTTSSAITTVGIFGRYYIPYNEKFMFFGELGLYTGFGSDEVSEIENNTTTTEITDLSLMSAGLSAGFTYMVHKNIGLDLNVGLLNFTQMTSRNDFPNGNYDQTTTTMSGLSFDLTTIRMGISVFL